MKLIPHLLPDDHTIVREAPYALLAQDGDVKGAAETLMDPAMLLLDGQQAITRSGKSPMASPKILTLSSYGDHAYVEQARALGASGYLVKHSGSHALAAAIRDIHSMPSFLQAHSLSPLQCP